MNDLSAERSAMISLMNGISISSKGIDSGYNSFQVVGTSPKFKAGKYRENDTRPERRVWGNVFGDRREMELK